MGYLVNSLDRGLHVLELLGESSEPLGPTAVGEILGVDRSTAYRLLRTLEARQFVQQIGSGGYRLGSKCIKLGTLALELTDLSTRARPFLEELADHLGFTVHLATLRNNRPIYIDKVQGRSILTVSTTIGGEAPLHCTASGKAFAAFLPPDVLEEIYGDGELPQYTKNTCKHLTDLEADLQKVREEGYAVDNEERHYGVRCVGAPVFDHRGQVVASVGISGPISEIDNTDFSQLKAVVIDVASRLSDQLGYTGSEQKRDTVLQTAT